MYATARKKAPIMGISSRERDVLKLVRPGRQLEIHRDSITAAEVMRKYPRHCITRPDVFKFPWIVVRPESVLVPGRVFYIVPYRTIYHLLKARGQCNKPCSRQNQSPKNHSHHCFPKRPPPLNSRHPHHHEQRLRKPVERTHQEAVASSQEEDSDDSSHSKRFYMKSWPKPIIKKRNTLQEFDQESEFDSSVDCRSFNSEDYYSDGRNISSALPNIRHGYLQQHKSSTQEVKLKSCLRKQDSVRKSLNLRVTFGLPSTIASSRRESPSASL
ncbi:unnamed protein product [Ilex paraguariensis]|uniref:Uncharacterized protein n=1 Tax=Ilex paraguariensis TaxID=185542 RepID=A0ABC8T8S0_9AQUA